MYIVHTTPDPVQAYLHNNSNSPKDPPSSDWDFFDDDEELIKVLEADDSTWLAVPETQQTQDDNQHEESMEQSLLDNYNGTITDSATLSPIQTMNADIEDPRSDISSVADVMLMSDHYADLPNSPEFSLDDLPIFSKHAMLENSDMIVDSQPVSVKSSHGADLVMEIEKEHSQSQHNDLEPTNVHFDPTLKSPQINDNNIESAEVVDHQFAEKMDMLDIIDEQSSLTPSAGIIQAPHPPPPVDFGRSEASNPNLEQQPSSTVFVQDETGSRFKLSLRQRNAIQLHPFTIEQARYQHLIGKSNLKGKMKAIITEVEDSQDTEFSLSNTQLVDIPTDEIETTQVSSKSSKKATSKLKTKKTSLPSKVNKRAQHRPTTQNADEISFEDISSPLFDKYGLDQLVLPPSNTRSNVNKKSKIITFEKKRRSRKGKSVARRFPPSSSSTTKDIFDFDAQPRSTFKLTSNISNSSNAASSSNQQTMISDDDVYLRRQAQEMNDDIDLYGYDDDNDSNDDDDDTEDMEIDNEDMIKRRFRVKKYAILDSSDEDSNEEELPAEKELTEAELDAIFSFPSSATAKPTGRRLMRSTADDDIIPVVEDELEYREHKRQRVGLRDVIKKKKALNSVLPASYLKVYEKELLEEDKLRRTPKKRTTKPQKTTATTSTAKNPLSTSKAPANVFAAFLDSQSEDSDDDSEDMQDAYPTLDDYVTRLDYPTEILTASHPIFEGSTASNNGIHSVFENVSLIDRPTRQISTNSNSELSRRIYPNTGSSPSLSRQPRSIKQPIYPTEESIEDNRIQRHYQGSALKKSPNKPKKLLKRAPRSSIAVQRPVNDPKKSSSMPIRDNPAPKKRRKKVKRTRDDIYVHASNSYRAWNDRSGQAPDNNGRTYFQDLTETPRMAFDDIYVGTRQYVRYANESLNGDRFNDLFENQQNQYVKEKLNVHVVHTLPSVISRVRHLRDYDLRRILGLKNTVYLHHRLLTPLLSAIPNVKSAYKHLECNYTDLKLFDKNFVWKSIIPENKKLIGHLFYKASGEIYKICSNNVPLEDTELPNHDHFYTFVSICLTQWIPLYPYEQRIQLTEIFMQYIRYLGQFVPRLVEEYKTGYLPWRPIVKIMIYILDWTCRLHHLGVHQIDWSVTQCTKSLIDILVFIGFDDIKSCSKDYLSEAWICLLQIMSVSSKTSGFYFHEQVFLDQITDSIKTKSRSSDVYEYEKRRTTRLWAESLNFIIEKYMVL
ncbi:hypothetical protein INT46_006203 [Mucor plumbeus]|uniref:Uncharacterized protein n=1 Tax=Mucor plumbeus TaxID=97098 RepID=A0A8H7QH13_9FUNG|nr:hypothetical protein INT46_006203 [Mucor plumbeus]